MTIPPNGTTPAVQPMTSLGSERVPKPEENIDEQHVNPLGGTAAARAGQPCRRPCGRQPRSVSESTTPGGGSGTASGRVPLGLVGRDGQSGQRRLRFDGRVGRWFGHGWFDGRHRRVGRSGGRSVVAGGRQLGRPRRPAGTAAAAGGTGRARRRRAAAEPSAPLRQPAARLGRGRQGAGDRRRVGHHGRCPVATTGSRRPAEAARLIRRRPRNQSAGRSARLPSSRHLVDVRSLDGRRHGGVNGHRHLGSGRGGHGGGGRNLEGGGWLGRRRRSGFGCDLAAAWAASAAGAATGSAAAGTSAGPDPEAGAGSAASISIGVTTMGASSVAASWTVAPGTGEPCASCTPPALGRATAGAGGPQSRCHLRRRPRRP